MRKLPRVMASSVIRGAQLGDSHGGLYLVDLDTGRVELTLDWNRPDIDFSGRGGDRGLRGIAFHGEQILVAGNSQLLVLDQDFRILEIFANPYLSHCHEISVAADKVFLTATGFDSVLILDLRKKRFIEGWHVGDIGGGISLRNFDPSTRAGPAEGNLFHINSVTGAGRRIYFSGLYTPGLMITDGSSLSMAVGLPPGTHNAQILEGGALYNDTAANRVCYSGNGTMTALAVPEFAPGEIVNADRFASTLARPGFARGLCVLSPGLIAGGSSPSTISVYDLPSRTRVSQVNLSMDVRNAIHGLAVWPFS